MGPLGHLALIQVQGPAHTKNQHHTVSPLMLKKQPLRTVIATLIALLKSLPRLDHLMAQKRRHHLDLAQVSARDLHIVPVPLMGQKRR